MNLAKVATIDVLQTQARQAVAQGCKAVYVCSDPKKVHDVPSEIVCSYIDWLAAVKCEKRWDRVFVEKIKSLPVIGNKTPLAWASRSIAAHPTTTILFTAGRA